MAQDKDISRTRETLLPGFFCLCCTLCGISEISTFHAYFHSSGIATSGVADDGALQPFATNITTSDIAFERPEGGASIEDDVSLEHIERGSHLGVRLSSSSSRWAHGRNEDPIVYAEMNQMYEIVGIKLIRSNSTFSSGVFHSPLSSPPRFISNDSNEVENRNTNIDSKDRAKEDFYDNYDDDDDGDNNDDDNNDDDDYETAEKSPPFGSCTYNNLLIKDDNIMNKSFGSRSQSQSIDRMASIAGDAHLLRLQQACQEHISLSHELGASVLGPDGVRSARVSSILKSSETSSTGLGSKPFMESRGLANGLESSGIGLCFFPIAQSNPNSQNSDIQRCSNDSSCDSHDNNEVNTLPTSRRKEEQRNTNENISIRNILLKKSSHSSSYLTLPCQSNNERGKEREEDKKSIISPGIQPSSVAYDTTGTTSPTTTVVSGAFSLIDPSCHSSSSTTSQSNSTCSITGNRDGDEKLIKVSIAFSEVLQLQGKAADAVAMIENLLLDLKSCQISHMSPSLLQSASFSSRELSVPQKYEEIEFNVTSGLGIGTDMDVVKSEIDSDYKGGNIIGSPIVYTTASENIKQHVKQLKKNHFNQYFSDKIVKDIDEEIAKNNLLPCGPPSPGHLVGESTVPTLNPLLTDSTDLREVSEYMWYKRNVALCYRRLGVLYKSVGRLAEAEESLRNFITLKEVHPCGDHYEMDGNEIEGMRDIANTFCLLAAIIDQIGGRTEEALAADKNAIELLALINQL